MSHFMLFYKEKEDIHKDSPTHYLFVAHVFASMYIFFRFHLCIEASILALKCVIYNLLC